MAEEVEFYRETEFKDTKIGKLPKEWEVTKLSNLIEVETGKRAKGGSLEKGNVASIGGEQIDDEGNILWDKMKFIPDDFYDLLKQGRVNLGDVLLVKDGATTGKVAIVKSLKYERVAVNEHVFIIRSKIGQLTNEFLFYFLFSKFGQIQIKKRFHGLIGGIIRSDLETILMPLPPLIEQQKIAEILSIVDEAIQKTDEIIAKTERLKRGLLQELLTKGIGHKEFKDTEIGKIPKEWEVVKLTDIAEDIYYGITAKAVENKTGLKMLRTTDIKDYTVDWGSLPFCEVTEKRGDIQRFLLKEGDLIIARAGSTGVSVLVEKDFDDVIFGSYLIKVRLTKKVHPKFMHYFCQSRLYWDHIASSQAGSTLKNINLPVLKSLNIPLSSSIEEQQKIAQILSIVDEAIQKTDEIIAKTERLKRGLLQELLTKGIGHKEFKDTEIGRIPKEWKTSNLGEVSYLIMGQSPPSKTYNRDMIGLPFLQGQKDFGDIYPNPSVYCSKPIKIAEEGDVLVSVRAPVGDINIATSKLCIGRGLAAIRPDKNQLDAKFIFYQLKHFSARLMDLGSGSTFKEIRRNDLERFPMVLPPLSEQQKIASVLSTVDEKLETLKQEKVKLERIKQWFMEELLTGRIRVRVA